MKKLFAATALATAMVASPAAAQTFTYEVQFGEPDMIGGMGAEGRDGRSAIMSGPYTTSSADGSKVSGTIRCVGMDQPDNGLFDAHLSCTATRTDGSQSSLIYGCNSLGEDRGFSCVGGMEGKSGSLTGRRGVLTMHLRRGTSVGTGQFIE